MSLIPNGWNIVDTSYGKLAKGDLNNDGFPDIAFTIEENIRDKSPSRKLIVAFGDKNNYSYTTMIVFDKLILNKDENGFNGDPLLGVEIKNQSLYIRYCIGDENKNIITYQVKYYSDEEWLLIS